MTKFQTLTMFTFDESGYVPHWDYVRFFKMTKFTKLICKQLSMHYVHKGLSSLHLIALLTNFAMFTVVNL